VNGRSAGAILSLLNRSGFLDGANPTSRDRNNSGWGFIYNLNLIADVGPPFAITLRQAGKARRVRVEGLTSQQISEAWKHFPSDREAQPKRTAELRFDGDVAVLTIPHWDYVEDGKRGMIDDIGDWFASIAAHSPR